jgi:hypothetical protein
MRYDVEKGKMIKKEYKNKTKRQKRTKRQNKKTT